MAVRNYVVQLAANYDCRLRQPKKAENPFNIGYIPELDTSSELEPEIASYYLNVINILRRMIKLGGIDIITKVSSFSSHVVLPNEGHLNAAVHIMAHVNSRLVYDFLYPEIDHNIFDM